MINRGRHRIAVLSRRRDRHAVQVVGPIVPVRARGSQEWVDNRARVRTVVDSREPKVLQFVRLAAADNVGDAASEARCRICGGLIEAFDRLRHRLMRLIHREAAVVQDHGIQWQSWVAIDQNQAGAKSNRNPVPG